MPSKMTLSTSLFITLLALSSPFLPAVHAAKPSSLLTTESLAADLATATDVSSQTDYTGSLDSSSRSSSVGTTSAKASSTAAAKSQWIQINTPMGKITQCSTIMLSWSSGGIDGPLEIDLVSATTGDMITIDPSIDLTTGQTTFKWTVAAPADTYYLQGNAQDFPSLLYSGNFTISQGTTTNCVNTAASVSGSAVASASAVRQSASATVSPSSGSTFDSGAGRVIVSGSLIASLGIFAALYF